MAGVAVVSLAYAWAAIRAGRRGGYGWWRAGSFAAGMVVLLGALNGPMHDLSERYLFSVHMLQHLLLTLVVPPLILLSLPPGGVDALVTPLGRPARLLTRPLLAFALPSAVLAIWHFPRFYDAALEHHGIHIAMHLSFLAGATLLWWPVVARGRVLPRLTPAGQMLYLFGLSLPMMFVGALIALADHPLYDTYAQAPRLSALLTPLEDQRLGGLLMWVPTIVLLVGVMTVVWFYWAKTEDSEG